MRNMGISPKQLIASDEAKATSRQHRKPCSDCPFARRARPGWLGNASAQQWMDFAHIADGEAECHITTNQLCAGLAIYRANVCKSPRNAKLILPADTEKVFAWPTEFLDHHLQRKERKRTNGTHRLMA